MVPGEWEEGGREGKEGAWIGFTLQREPAHPLQGAEAREESVFAKAGRLRSAAPPV